MTTRAGRPAADGPQHTPQPTVGRAQYCIAHFSRHERTPWDGMLFYMPRLSCGCEAVLWRHVLTAVCEKVRVRVSQR